MSEKIGGVEGTKFTDEFTQLERVSLWKNITVNKEFIATTTTTNTLTVMSTFFNLPENGYD